MWKFLLPEVKEVHLDFWFACACFNAFSMRERAREWGMRIILQVWKPPSLGAVVSGFHAYIGGDARWWEGWRLRDQHACLSVRLSSRRRGYRALGSLSGSQTFSLNQQESLDSQRAARSLCLNVRPSGRICTIRIRGRWPASHIHSKFTVSYNSLRAHIWKS